MTPDEKTQIDQLKRLRAQIMLTLEGASLAAKERGDQPLYEELIYQGHKVNSTLFHIEQLIGNPIIAYRGTMPDTTLGGYVKSLVDRAADKLRSLG